MYYIYVCIETVKNIGMRFIIFFQKKKAGLLNFGKYSQTVLSDVELLC